jgi:hypothetical protein
LPLRDGGSFHVRPCTTCHTADPASPEVGHPLAGVYRALRLAVASHGVLYLSREHRELLAEAIR